jgi:hypothetical protein
MTREEQLEYYKNYNATKRPNSSEYHKENYATNKDKILAQKKQYNIDNAEKVKAQKRANYLKNVVKHLTTKKEYRESNKGKVNALSKMRKVNKINRTPKWTSDLDIWLMKEIYELATLRTKLTGIDWHVDHIIPLQGSFVSGLHTPFNMQVIPAIENIKKGNKYEF